MQCFFYFLHAVESIICEFPLSLLFIVSLAFISADIMFPFDSKAGAIGSELIVLKFVSSKSRCSFANSGHSLTMFWMPCRVYKKNNSIIQCSWLNREKLSTSKAPSMASYCRLASAIA